MPHARLTAAARPHTHADRAHGVEALVMTLTAANAAALMPSTNWMWEGGETGSDAVESAPAAAYTGHTYMAAPLSHTTHITATQGHTSATAR